jgi:hypothetical protein
MPRPLDHVRWVVLCKPAPDRLDYDGCVADDAAFDIDAPVGADDVERVAAAARERGGQISLDDALRLLTRRPTAQQRAVDDAIARVEQRPTPLRSEVGATVADVLPTLIRESVTCALMEKPWQKAQRP